MMMKKKDVNNKRGRDNKTESCAQLELSSNKKQKVGNKNEVISLPTPVPCNSAKMSPKPGQNLWSRDSGQGAVMTELVNFW